uniref:Uncharacterized protein n=1 Tax=Oryza barthii TaxID=65489 RepID=A0A0D3HTX1_9ORYZ
MAWRPWWRPAEGGGRPLGGGATAAAWQPVVTAWRLQRWWHGIGVAAGVAPAVVQWPEWRRRGDREAGRRWWHQHGRHWWCGGSAQAQGNDGCAKGAGGGGSSSSLPVGTLVLPGAPPLLCGEFLSWIEMTAGETQAFDETSSSSGFSFCQNQRGGQRVAGRRRPGLAFRGSGKVQHLVWKLIGGGAPVWWGGGLMLPLPVRWFLS